MHLSSEVSHFLKKMYQCVLIKSALLFLPSSCSNAPHWVSLSTSRVPYFKPLIPTGAADRCKARGLSTSEAWVTSLKPANCQSLLCWEYSLDWSSVGLVYAVIATVSSYIHWPCYIWEIVSQQAATASSSYSFSTPSSKLIPDPWGVWVW